jgi:hypothetical protein
MSNNNQRVDTVPVPDNHSDYRDRLLSDAVAVQPLTEFFEGVQQTAARDAKQARIDAAQARLARVKRRLDETERRQAETERAQEHERTRQKLTLIDMLTKASRRMDSLEAQKERQDRARVRKYLDTQADPDDPSSWGELSTPILPPENPELELDDQAGFATRATHDPDDPASWGYEEMPQTPQPTAVELNEADHV